MQIEKVKIDSLILDPANARKHNQKNLEAIKGSLAKFGQQKVVVVDENNVVIAGNGTVQEAKALGWTEIVVNRTDLRGSDKTAFAIADNRSGELAAWDDDVLSKTLQGLKDDGIDLGAIGFDDDDLAQWLKAEPQPGDGDGERATLSDTFGVPPFSVLDARQGYWQDRKRMWLALGIKSELGRGGGGVTGGSPEPMARFKAGMKTTWQENNKH